MTKTLEELEAMDAEQRAEARDTIERLSAAIHDACEIWGTLYVAAMLHNLGPALARKI
jgi:hypothetical protein